MQVTSPAPGRAAVPLLVAVAGAVVVVVAAAVAWFLLRPGASAASTVSPAVTIECTAATGADAEACLAWGDATLADDPAPNTFEREDLRRLRLDRSSLGFGSECTVELFISRYPDRPVWSGTVACR